MVLNERTNKSQLNRLVSDAQQAKNHRWSRVSNLGSDNTMTVAPLGKEKKHWRVESST